MNTRAWSSAIALASLVSVMGCGGDESMTPGVGAGGAGGASGAAGGGTAGASGGGAAPIPCGPKVCMTPQLPPGGAMGLPIMIRPACCADPVMGVCGSQNGAMCMPPLPPAPNCPKPPSFGSVMTNACCIEATQLCGVDASMIGMGCFNIGAIPGLGGGGQTKCDGTPVAPPAAGAPAVAGAGGQSVAGAGGATAGAGGAGGGIAGGAAGAAAGRGAGGRGI